jgi:hypothetical protein
MISLDDCRGRGGQVVARRPKIILGSPFYCEVGLRPWCRLGGRRVQGWAGGGRRGVAQDGEETFAVGDAPGCWRWVSGGCGVADGLVVHGCGSVLRRADVGDPWSSSAIDCSPLCCGPGGPGSPRARHGALGPAR